MEHTRHIARMERFPRVVRMILDGVSDEDARWKPGAKDWSIVEVVAHLADEDAEDFGARLRSILEDPQREWAPTDPEGWSVQRKYNERDLATELDRFETERAQAIAWLRGLGAIDWGVEKRHPKFGSMRAGDLMASWAAHDLLHQRQLTKRLYQITLRDSEPFASGYAGDW